jgi:hypothetical protein
MQPVVKRMLDPPTGLIQQDCRGKAHSGRVISAQKAAEKSEEKSNKESKKRSCEKWQDFQCSRIQKAVIGSKPIGSLLRGRTCVSRMQRG